MKQQFDLSLWLKNKSRKICTREGKDVVIIYTDSPVPHYPIVGFICKSIYTWTIDGKLIYGKEEQDKNDLFFADEEPQSAEFSFGAFDSEFVKDEYLIPEGCEARIEGNKVIIEKIQKEEKLTEFEEQLASILFDREYEGKTNTEDDIERSMLPYRLAAKEYSQELLDLARKELQPEFDKEMDKMLAETDKVVYQKGHEDELTEFEKEVERILDLCCNEIGETEVTEEWVKEDSAILLDLARKELEANYYTKVVDDRIVFKSGLHDRDLQGAYELGKQDAFKDLPKWKYINQIQSGNHYAHIANGIINPSGYFISYDDLEALPKEE